MQHLAHTAGSHATLSTHPGSYVSRNVHLTFIQQQSHNQLPGTAIQEQSGHPTGDKSCT